MLNVGVGLWWALRPPAAAPEPWSQSAGVPRLQLLGEVADAVVGLSEPPPESAAASTSLRCMAFGPFDSAAAVAEARVALQPLGAAHMRVRDVVEAPRGWRVLMPPQVDRAAADALAERIRQAGFDDLVVVSSGEDTNAIALGLYGSEPAARRREASLRAAGFPAQARPMGNAVTTHWLDVAAGPGFDADAARRAAAAPRLREIDCAGVVEAGAAR